MNRILSLLVISQLFCTSLWFGINAILPDLAKTVILSPSFLADVTSAIQAGFILGTLVFAVFTISDRVSPSKVFFICSIISALINICLIFPNTGSGDILVIRFLTGFFLAGIYPVGMKIAADHFEHGLGRSLGYLVGALVLGTSLPHLLKTLASGFPFHYPVVGTSLLATLGGLTVILFVPDGPYQKRAQKLKLTAFVKAFKVRNFRSMAFGYFGHMWELYTFWTFVPVMLTVYNENHDGTQLPVHLLSFAIIAAGSVSCVAAGILSKHHGEKRIAILALSSSCVCCLLSPLFLFSSSALIFTAFLFFWGLVVIADSPLFSALIAGHAPPEIKGTSLTIVTCIGFSITIVSIQLLSTISRTIDTHYLFLFLAIGPALGLLGMASHKIEGSLMAADYRSPE